MTDRQLRIGAGEQLELTGAPGPAACEWCGGEAAVGPCPRSVQCPRCGAAAGSPCRSPSGHRRNFLHAARVALAERDAVEAG